MTTEQYLKKIELYDKIVLNKKREIEELRAIASSVTIPPKDVNVQASGDKDKIGAIVVEIVNLEDEITSIIKKRHNIVKEIESVPDIRLYDVLEQAYVQCKEIKEIEIVNAKSDRHKKRLLVKARTLFESMYGDQYLNKCLEVSYNVHKRH